LETLPSINIFLESSHGIYNSYLHNNCQDKEIKTVTIHITLPKTYVQGNILTISHNKTYEIILFEIISQLEFILEETITKL